MVDELAAKFAGQKNLVLVDAGGLTANQAVELRAQLREGGVRMRMVKNSVAVHTFRKLGISAFEKHLARGMNAVVYGPDPLVIAKKLAAYREKHRRAEVKFAIVEGREADAASVAALAKLPGREQILASFFGTLNGVAAKFASALYEIPRVFVATLKAVSEKS